MPRSASAAELPTRPPPMIATSQSMRRVMLPRIDGEANSQGDRLDRRLRPQPPDRADVSARLCGQQLRGGNAAHATLAAPHADAGHGLETIDLGDREIADRAPCFARADLLA